MSWLSWRQLSVKRSLIVCSTVNFSSDVTAKSELFCEWIDQKCLKNLQFKVRVRWFKSLLCTHLDLGFHNEKNFLRNDRSNNGRPFVVKSLISINYPQPWIVTKSFARCRDGAISMIAGNLASRLAEKKIRAKTTSLNECN